MHFPVTNDLFSLVVFERNTDSDSTQTSGMSWLESKKHEKIVVW